MLKFIYISLICLAAISSEAIGQSDTTTTSGESEKDTLWKDNRLFNGVRFGADVAGFAYGPVSDQFKDFRNVGLTGDFGIRRFFVVLDLGQATAERLYDKQATIIVQRQEIAVANYYNSKASGIYIRAGADYRISKSAKSFLFVGGRFCKAIFNEELDYSIQNQYYPTPIEPNNTLNKKASSVNWTEFTGGVKVFIFKNFYLGYNVRFKARLRKSAEEVFETVDIPGFGLAKRNADMLQTNVGFSFNIMYRIPFGKDPEIPLKGR